MPRTRTTTTSRQEFSRETLEDRPKEQEFLKTVTDNGIEAVSSTNRVPVDVEDTLEKSILLSNDNLLCELRKLNEYMSIITGVRL